MRVEINMNYPALKAYIEADPTFAGWIAGGNDQQIADEINKRTVSAVRDVSKAVFAMWVGGSGLRGAMEDHANNSQSPLRSIALTLKDFLQGSVADSIDFSITDNVAMLDAWVAAAAITPTQKNELLALATVQLPVFGQQVSNIDVAVAFGRTGVN